MAVSEIASPTDEDLARRARSEPGGFDAIFDRYWDSLFRYAYYRVGDWQDAEDVAQSALIAASQQLNRFSPKPGTGGFRAWLFTIAHNASVDALERRRRSPHVPLSEEMATHWPTPEQAAISAQTHDWLIGLLGQLPPDQRDVMALRLGELTTREIAEVLGKREDNVRKLTERARDRLDQLQQHEGGRDER